MLDSCTLPVIRMVPEDYMYSEYSLLVEKEECLPDEEIESEDDEDFCNRKKNSKKRRRSSQSKRVEISEEKESEEESEEKHVSLLISYGVIVIKGVIYASKSSRKGSPTTHRTDPMTAELPVTLDEIEDNLKSILAASPFFEKYIPGKHVPCIMGLNTKMVNGSLMHYCEEMTNESTITLPGTRQIVIYLKDAGEETDTDAGLRKKRQHKKPKQRVINSDSEEGEVINQNMKKSNEEVLS